jgi:hypothetical protein
MKNFLYLILGALLLSSSVAQAQSTSPNTNFQKYLQMRLVGGKWYLYRDSTGQGQFGPIGTGGSGTGTVVAGYDSILVQSPFRVSQASLNGKTFAVISLPQASLTDSGYIAKEDYLKFSTAAQSVSVNTSDVLYSPYDFTNNNGSFLADMQLKTQNANLMFLSPNGVTGKPLFRTPVKADLGGIPIAYLDQANNFGGNTLENFSAKLNDQTGTTYTLLASDNGKVLTFNNASAITLTVPASLPVGFNVSVVQKGAGQVTFVASGVTIINRQAFTKTAGQYAVASLMALSANFFVSGGDLQ